MIIKLCNWDYDFLDVIICGEVDIGFFGCESYFCLWELLSLLLLVIDYEVLFSDVFCVWLCKDYLVLYEMWNLDIFLCYLYISICWE